MELKELIDLSNKAFQENNFQKVIELLKKVILIQPNRYEIYFRLGLASNNLGNLKDAISYFEKAVLINPNSAPTFCNLGNLYAEFNEKNLALKNAKRIIKETKCDAVKLEGGKKIIKQIKFLIKNKIPVLGHLGLLPQSVKGKFKSKGKTNREIKQLISDALLLQKTGVFAIVLECVKTPIAKKITNDLKIPTIGIGSSVYCDGQVLVTDDLIGLNQTNIKFVKKFLNVKKYINSGLRQFALEVRSQKYPTKKHSY